MTSEKEREETIRAKYKQNGTVQSRTRATTWQQIRNLLPKINPRLAALGKNAWMKHTAPEYGRTQRAQRRLHPASASHPAALHTSAHTEPLWGAGLRRKPGHQDTFSSPSWCHQQSSGTGSGTSTLSVPVPASPSGHSGPSAPQA